MYRVETRVEESDKDYVNAVAFEDKEEAEEARRALSLTPGSHKVVSDKSESASTTTSKRKGK